MKKGLPTALRYLLPGFGDILWIGAFLGVMGLGPRLMNVDGDLGRHLTIGAYILDQGRIPTSDLFSHTMLGQALTPHEWLAQVIFALADRLMGLDGVVLVCGLVIATSFWLVYRLAREQSRGVLLALIMAMLAMAAASLHWLSRPHLFTFLFLAIWLRILEDLRCGRVDRWWLMPLVMLPWANLHGAFVAGFATWGLYGTGLAWDRFWSRSKGGRAPKGEGLHGHFWRAFLLGGGAALLVTLINPSGIGLWGTSIGYIGNRYLVGRTAEYLPPNFHDISTWPFLVMIGIVVAVFGLKTRRLEGCHVLPAAAWLVMALYSVRNVPLFAIAAAPVVAGALGGWLEENHHRLNLLTRLQKMDQGLLHMELQLRGLVWPALAAVLVIAGLQGGLRLDLFQAGNRFDPEVFPVQAVEWLESHPQDGEMFNYFPWGGYLLYRTWPEKRVFIDGQTDFYGEALSREYEQALTLSPGWEDILSKYRVGWAILPPGEALAQALSNRAGWERVYQDETAVILSLED